MNRVHRIFRQKKCLVGIGLLCILLLSSCSFPGLTETSARLPAVGESQQAASLPPIHFPQDEGAHNNLTEWWYYTGHLNATDASGKEHLYGFELVVFQAMRSDLPAVYPAHFAISDITQNEFHYDQRSVTNYTGPVPDGKSTQGIDAHVGDWSIQGINGHDHLVAQMKDYAINLNLAGTKPATLHNSNGLITDGLGGFSYYYSRTRMAVSGTLLDHKQQLHVSGQAWMDHQWGNFLTLGGGWDWYSIQLNNNTEMMLYLIHDALGAVHLTYIDYVDASGKDTIIPASALHTTVLDTWTSPTTRITYPSGWQLELKDPHLQATFVVKPLLKNQELIVTNSTGNVYWEGAVSIDGQANGLSVAGQGYVELTGYAKK